MRSISLWFSFGIALGSCLAFTPSQDHQALRTIRFDPQEEQGPFEAVALHDGSEAHTRTIYEILSNNPRFTLVTKALNFVDDVATLLNDSSSDVTFFAPPDRALRHPGHGHHVPHKNRSGFSSIDQVTYNLDFDETMSITEFRDFPKALEMLDEINVSRSDSPDHERKKNILKIILRAILSYHIVPTAYNLTSLGRNTTYATGLTISGTYGGQPLRLRVSQSAIPPSTHINFFTSIVRPNVKATNGIIHVVDHPLLPPLSVFQELYMVPRFFSILTSAIQRSNLTKTLDLRYIHDKGLDGTPLVTIFAPTNHAFEKLPAKLKIFLFSPFGERVLAKLLQYHIVAGAVVHSNYIFGEHVKETLPESLNNQRFCGSKKPQDDHWKHPKHVERVASHNLTLQPLLLNHTIHAYIVQNKITFPFPGPKKPSTIDTKIFVNWRLVVVPDIVGFNGAIHVINKLLDPRKVHHHPGHNHGLDSDRRPEYGPFEDAGLPEDWEDWENWLPQWAEHGNL